MTYVALTALRQSHADLVQAERPTCALCKKWGLKCEYAVPASKDNGEDELHESYTLFGRQPFVPYEYRLEEPQNLSHYLDEQVELPGSDIQDPISTEPTYPTPSSGLDSLISGFDGPALPSDDTLSELVTIFFDQFYHCFPCFHKATLLAAIQNHRLKTESPLFCYAISAVAAVFHPDPAVKSRQDDWYEQAKLLYEFTGRDLYPPLRTIQSVSFLVFHGYSKGDFSACWLWLGKVWRQIAAMGINRMDSSAVVMALGRKDERTEKVGSYGRIEWEGRTAIEREECRRTLWLLFMMDRTQSWPTGWAHAVEERQFKIDLPISEAVFQAMMSETELSTIKNVPFSRNMNILIRSVAGAKEPLNLLQYLAVAHVLLGRITELIHSLHETPDTPEYAQECDELDAALVKFRLSLPRLATSLVEASPEDRGQVIWLNIILNSMSILLHYRAAGLASSKSTEELFALSVSAAKSTTAVIRDTARISVSLLLNTHIAPSLYIASCVLIIHWRLTGDESCKDDIELFNLVYERMNDVFSVIGLKFKIALRKDLERDRKEMEVMREKGFRGLLADCSKWGYVANEVAKLGQTMT